MGTVVEQEESCWMFSDSRGGVSHSNRELKMCLTTPETREESGEKSREGEKTVKSLGEFISVFQ